MKHTVNLNLNKLATEQNEKIIFLFSCLKNGIVWNKIIQYCTVFYKANDQISTVTKNGVLEKPYICKSHFLSEISRWSHKIIWSVQTMITKKMYGDWVDISVAHWQML